MNENGAAPAETAAAHIVIEDGDYVVKAVLAPERFRACGVGQRNGAVVVAVAGRIAPAKPGTQRYGGKRRAGPPQPVWAVVNPHRLPSSARACSIALPLACAHAAFSNRGRKSQVPETHDS